MNKFPLAQRKKSKNSGGEEDDDDDDDELYMIFPSMVSEMKTIFWIEFIYQVSKCKNL